MKLPLECKILLTMMIIDILSDLVGIPSAYPRELKISDFIQKFLQDSLFRVKRLKVSSSRYNVIAEKGRGNKYLLFGHLDTVKIQDGWVTNPYTLTQDGDKLFGLGAWDMKGGLAAILSACRQFTPKNFKLLLAFTVDEEAYSIGMHQLLKLEYLKNLSGAITAEPGFDYGHLGICLGRIGRVVYNIRLKTTGGHVYLASQSSNAILESEKLLRLLMSIKPIKHPHLGQSFIVPRSIQSSVQSMSIPSDLSLDIECFVVPPQTPDSVLKQLQEVLCKEGIINGEVSIKFEERPTPFCEPYEINRNNPFVKSVESSLKEVISEAPVFYYRHSVGDENRVAKLGIPVVTVGPLGENAHFSNEWVSKSSLLKIEQFYKNLLLNIDSTASSKKNY